MGQAPSSIMICAADSLATAIREQFPNLTVTDRDNAAMQISSDYWGSFSISAIVPTDVHINQESEDPSDIVYEFALFMNDDIYRDSELLYEDVRRFMRMDDVSAIDVVIAEIYRLDPLLTEQVTPARRPASV